MKIVVHVEVVEPGVPEDGTGEQVFMAETVTIGRAGDNDIVLREPRVSGHHGKVLVDHGDSGPRLCFVDLQSSNGTYRGAQKIEANTTIPLEKSDQLLIGPYVITAGIGSLEEIVEVARPQSETASQSSEPDPAPVRERRGSLFRAEVETRRRIHERLIERLDLRRYDVNKESEEVLRARAKEIIEEILVELRWEIPDGLDREALITGVLDEALGLGPLEELLADDAVSEIMVNNFQQVFAEREGRLDITPYRFSSEGAVLAAIERIIAPIGRRIDESSPMVDARLKDGSRVNAVIRPLALEGPCITIRKFAKDPLRITDLVNFGSLSQGMADFLQLAVHNRMNIVISGGTGSGKTTLLNVIAGFIPHEERVITVEDAAELQLPQEHVVRFETRPPNLEGKGAITIRHLVKNALRMRPDRIVVGECRGAEALDMLQAMNTGHDGSMTTGHANSPIDMISRLETMVLTSGVDLPIRAVREQISSAVNLVIQQTRFSCGTRKVTAISELMGLDEDEGTVVLQDIFVFRQDGYDVNGKVQGHHQAVGYVPKFFRKLQERGLPVDANVFSPG